MREIGAKVQPSWVDLERAHGISRRGDRGKCSNCKGRLERAHGLNRREIGAKVQPS